MSADTSPPRRHRTNAEINTAGIGALVDALGVADTARFLQQYGPGLGDYTAERGALLDDLSLDAVLEASRQFNAEDEGAS